MWRRRRNARPKGASVTTPFDPNAFEAPLPPPAPPNLVDGYQPHPHPVSPAPHRDAVQGYLAHKKLPPPGPYSGTMSRALWRS